MIRVGVGTHPRLDRLALRLETEEDLQARRRAVTTSRWVEVATHTRLDWLALPHLTAARSPLEVDMETHRDCWRVLGSPPRK